MNADRRGSKRTVLSASIGGPNAFFSFSLELAPEEIDGDRDYLRADGMFAVREQSDF